MGLITHGYCELFPIDVIVTQPKISIKTVQILNRK
jgi:hypothetical protein